MQIQFSVDGGLAVFPGLARPVSIDVDTLPAAAAGALRSAIAKSRFFDRTESSPAAKGAADMRSYSVTIEDGSLRRTLTIPETADDPQLRALVGLLEEHRRNALKR